MWIIFSNQSKYNGYIVRNKYTFHKLILKKEVKFKRERETETERKRGQKIVSK